MIPIRSEILSAFEVAARNAGAEILKAFRRSSEFRLKDPMQVLTDADLASHEILAGFFTRAFSDIPLVLEEQENSEPLPKTYFVCDELDGSALFTRGISDFSVILGYVENGRPYAGCIYFPNSDSFVFAERGKGAYLDGRRIEFSGSFPLAKSVLSLEINNTLSEEDFSWIFKVVKSAMTSRSLGATGAGFRELLSGGTDLFLNLNGAKVWDFAAGAVAIEEAGGTLLDKNGQSLAWDKIRMSAVIGKDKSLIGEAFGLKPR
ncbi:inositol monophosphatase family protein [Leptospira fletcheri]|uniref:inositol monophosphatase family protein n=1 Tax=Leptospira fletcheri TaxID=2484981 RepID=UPI001FE58877|nr:inositol monophosphatase family protein [Leptospira fletcheri]